MKERERQRFVNFRETEREREREKTQLSKVSVFNKLDQKPTENCCEYT